jgi:holo-[acyl-carrier protein] synthase
VATPPDVTAANSDYVRVFGRVAMIIGHGVDLVSIENIVKLVNDPGEHFLTRCFTDSERAAVGGGINMPERVAARFAAKEAVLKALGTGFGGDIGFVDVEILTLSSGAPHVVLHRGAQAAAKYLHVGRWIISMSHDGGMAIASAIAVGD